VLCRANGDQAGSLLWLDSFLGLRCLCRLQLPPKLNLLVLVHAVEPLALLPLHIQDHAVPQGLRPASPCVRTDHSTHLRARTHTHTSRSRSWFRCTKAIMPSAKAVEPASVAHARRDTMLLRPRVLGMKDLPSRRNVREPRLHSSRKLLM
jgi:hypothetical protein